MTHLRRILTLSIAAAALPAQSNPLPEWVTLPFTNVISHFAEATLVVAQEPDTIHAYSSLTRSWSALGTAAGATWRGYDDHVLVKDGTTFWGYSTRLPRWTSVVAPAGVLPTTSGAFWNSAVVDGNDLHYFSSFSGRWTTVRLAATPTTATARLVVAYTDGTTTGALSAHFGTPVPIATVGAVAVAATGLCGVVQDDQGVHCFSAYRNCWTTIPTSPTATVVRPPGRASFVVVQDGPVTWFYSAMTGTTTTVASNPNSVLRLSDDIAVQSDSATGQVDCYSGIAGRVETRTMPTSATVTLRRYLATFEYPNTVEAFSAPLGRFAAPLAGSYTITSDLAAVIAVSGTTPTHAYSPVRNAWSAVPVAIPGGQPFVTWCSAAVVDPAGGLYGFSAQTGTWAFVPAPATTNVWRGNAMFCAQSGTRLDVFNPRLCAWRTVETDAPVTAVTCFDQALLARYADSVWVYCLYSDRWANRTLGTPILGTEVRDELAIAWEASTLHVFGASDQLSNVAIFPYYWRVLARGGPLTYHLAGVPGSAALVLIGARPAHIEVPPFGTLLVQPAGALFFGMPPLPDEGIARLDLIIPDDPGLVGVTLHAQALVLQGNGAYLTNLNTMGIF